MSNGLTRVTSMATSLMRLLMSLYVYPLRLEKEGVEDHILQSFKRDTKSIKTRLRECFQEISFFTPSSYL